MIKIFDFLKQYTARTNNLIDLKEDIFPYIRIDIDEAHIYFPSRGRKDFDKDSLLVMTQCRKRNMAFNFVSQELSQLDIFMRRLMPYIMYYKKRLFGFTLAYMFYFKVKETTDIGDEMKVEEIEKEYIRPDKIQLLFNKKLKLFYIKFIIIVFH